MIPSNRLKSLPTTISVSFILFVLLTFVLAACGSSTGSGGYGGGSGSTATTPTTSGSGSGHGGGYGYPTPTSQATPTTGGSSSSALIHTATATISGKSETILTNAKGLTLYYNTHDTATTSACTGGCASAWPPLLANSASDLTTSTTLPGKLSIVHNANGSQVEYNGHPLYTFASDTAAGQTSGQGIGGIWFVAPTNLS